MAVLSKTNAILFHTRLENLEDEINALPTLLNKVDDLVDKGDGSEFNKEYPKGKKACKNIKEITSTFRAIKKELNQLVSAAQAFYNTSEKASNK